MPPQTTHINNVNMTENSDPQMNPRDVLANLFHTSFPNIAWAIRRAPEYDKNFNANGVYHELIDHTCTLLGNIETSLELLHTTNTAQERTITAQEQTITTLQQSNQALNTLVTSLQATVSQPTASAPKAQPKRKSKDPEAFDGKGSPIERQEKFEVWETKIRNVFQRDADYFHTPLDKVLYMSEMLSDKAYDYVKYGLDMLHQNDASKYIFSDQESMLDYMRKHYKTIDTTQVAKNRLDTLSQGERNYWSWKAELDELMTKAHKTEEQKVDLLKKNISSKMKTLVLNLPSRIGAADYNGWSEQMDVFARNLQDHTHQAKLNNPKPSGHPPHQSDHSAAAPSPVGEPMDLDRISDHERKRRIDNKLCLACGQPGHWKEAHDPTKTVNPIPMPARQTMLQPNRDTFGPPRGRGINYGRGGRGKSSYPAGSSTKVMPYRGTSSFGNVQQQWRMRVTDPHEHGYIIDEETSSTALSDNSNPSDFTPSRQDSPTPQSSKGQPLD